MAPPDDRVDHHPAILPDFTLAFRAGGEQQDTGGHNFAHANCMNLGGFLNLPHYIIEREHVIGRTSISRDIEFNRTRFLLDSIKFVKVEHCMRYLCNFFIDYLSEETYDP